jgi:hypothetical protein
MFCLDRPYIEAEYFKNKNRKNFYTPQNLKAHWLQAAHPITFFSCFESDAIKAKFLFWKE